MSYGKRYWKERTAELAQQLLAAEQRAERAETERHDAFEATWRERRRAFRAEEALREEIAYVRHQASLSSKLGKAVLNREAKRLEALLQPPSGEEEPVRDGVFSREELNAEEREELSEEPKGEEREMLRLRAARDSVVWTGEPPKMDELQHAIGTYNEFQLDTDAPKEEERG